MPMVGVPEMYGPPPVPFNTEPTPEPAEQFSASFAQNSIFVSAARALALQGWEPREGYKASWDDIKDHPHYVDHAEEFSAAVSPAHFEAIKAGIDQDVKERRIAAASGMIGLVGSLLAQVDPTMLLPGRVMVGVLKGGMPVARGALEVGAAAGLQTGLQEAFLRAGHPERTLGEGVASVGSSAVLGGLLGGAARFMSPAERAVIVGKMDRERAIADAHAMGAAATDTRTMEDLTVVPTGIGLEKLPDNIVTRTLQKASLTARRAAADLAETAVLVKGNLEGKTTTLGGGPSLETISRHQQRIITVKLQDALAEAWRETNFAGQKAPWAAKLRDDLASFGLPTGLPPDRVTFEEFKKQVGDAVMNDGRHDNPHIQRVAEQVKSVFDRWATRAEAAIPGFKRAEQYPGESYFPHVWNKVVIQAKRPAFVDKVTEKLVADQGAKKAIQDTLRSRQGALEQHETNIKTYARQLEKKQADLAEDEALREEVTRLNKFGHGYAEDLREGQYKNVGGIREADPDKNIEKARGGAVFETEIRKRGNTLADRASAHRAQVADLEEKLQAEHASAAAMRAKIEEELGNWHGKSAAEAKTAIHAREKAEAKRTAKGEEPAEPKGGRLASADAAVDRAVNRILGSDRDRPVQELRDRADEIVDRIISSPDGRLPYDEASSRPQIPHAATPPLRGSLAERAFDVSNAWARDWIERDVERAVENHLRTFMPDVLLSERFGDAEMSTVFRKINEDYAKAVYAAGADEKEAARLGKERDAAIRDVAILRDRLRGLYRIPTDASARNIGRISAAARNFSTITSMGMAAISSIPDAANVIARWGLGSVFNDAWAPFLKSLMTNRELTREAYRQFKAMGIAMETVAAARHHELSGIAEPYVKASRFETTLQYGADKMQLLNLMGPQSDILKTIASTVAATELHKAAKAAAAGTATKAQLRALGEANIAPHMYERIAAQYEKSGTMIDDVLLPNTEDWADKEARAVFEGALQREASLSVVTPGIDKPAFLSDPVLAVLTQFKSFTAAATTRILVANLQRADAQTLQGLIASLGFGATAYLVHSVVSGQPTSDRPQDWIKEAISRGNLLGWLDEANTLASKMTRGRVDMYRAVGADKPLSRDAGRTAVENLMGPTFGKLANLTRVTGAAASGEWTAGDLHAVRRLTGYQNLWFLNRALTAVEKSVGPH